LRGNAVLFLLLVAFDLGAGGLLPFAGGRRAFSFLLFHELVSTLFFGFRGVLKMRILKISGGFWRISKEKLVFRALTSVLSDSSRMIMKYDEF